MGRSPAPIPLAAVLALPLLPGRRSAEVFVGGDLEVRLYAPKRRDRQGPHDLDELYIVVGDTRHLRCGERDDFAAWVIFYGPQI